MVNMPSLDDVPTKLVVEDGKRYALTALLRKTADLVSPTLYVHAVRLNSAVIIQAILNLWCRQTCISLLGR